MTLFARWSILLLIGLAADPALAISVSIQKLNDAPCGQSLGALGAMATGGTGGYTYSWSDGGTGGLREFLPPGEYTVTATDDLGETATATETILATSQHGSGHSAFAPTSACDGAPYAELYFHTPYWGPDPHIITDPDAGGSVVRMGDDGYRYVHVWTAMSPGDFVLEWTDANGCPGVSSFEPSYGFDPMVDISDVQGACAGNNGHIAGSSVNMAGARAVVALRDADGQMLPGVPPQLFEGASAFLFDGLAPGMYQVLVYPDVILCSEEPPSGLTACAATFHVEVPDLTGNCGTVSGTVYIDNDADCMQAPTEAGVAYRQVAIMPGSIPAYTDANGRFSRNLPNGTYTLAVEGTGTELVPLCPAVQPIPFTVAGTSVVVDVADSSSLPLDLEAWIGCTPARPGFGQRVWLEARNRSAHVSGPLDLTFTFDDQLTFLAAGEPPTSISGHTLTWTGLDALTAYADRRLYVDLQVPPDVDLIGQPFLHSFAVAQALSDGDPGNNIAEFTGTITGSFDPNDKLARTSSYPTDGSSYVLDEDSYLDYTIRFQNTGTDTAFTVVVRDTLSTWLDPATFEQGTASHAFTVVFKPHNVVEWTFANILLPDSATHEPGSHGLVNFRIKPVEEVLPGTEIRNAADIFFDFNPPVRTPDAVTLVEAPTGIAATRSTELQVFPNPAGDRVTIGGIPAGTSPQVRLVAADGRVALQRSLPADRTLDLQALPAGVYLLQLEDRVHRLVKY